VIASGPSALLTVTARMASSCRAQLGSGLGSRALIEPSRLTLSPHDYLSMA
jgi:hypothetical protein